ncbi:unnamed protein product [Moneuplotes crassus]|uniref:Leucine Rich Repeat family protein n=1 Tax=Euplotes crassus TaxID=5936 RepID=A0AAD1XB59_EUPCR|nr:unnamed protein product [Moneuplotes crassus]
MRRTDILKSQRMNRSHKLKNQFTPTRTTTHHNVRCSVRRSTSKKAQKINMRQFFSINPDLVRNHLTSTQCSTRSYNPMSQSQKTFSITPKGKIIKKENITLKISKINNALLPDLKKIPQKASKNLFPKPETSVSNFTTQGRARFKNIFPKKFNTEMHKLEIKAPRKQVQTARKSSRTKKKKIDGFLESQRKLKFGNIDINNVNQLRASCSKPTLELLDFSSSSNDSDEDSLSSLKAFKRTSVIQIGNLENKDIVKAKEVYGAVKNPRKEESEPYDHFLKKCNMLKLVPSPMGIVKKAKEMGEIVKLNGYKIGNDYAEIFGKIFKKTNQRIVTLEMRSNKLEDKGAIPIINNLNEFIVTIDLSSNNRIGTDSYQLLSEKMSSKFFRLKKLSLDHNNISKSSFKALCDGIAYSTSLKTLNLNHNNFQNEHACILAEVLQDCALKMLFIAWNKIRDKGAVAIFNALRNNHSLQILDASFNSLSSSMKRGYGNISHNSLCTNEEGRNICKSAIALNQMFEKNSTLIHMDLSHNCFSDEDCKEISKGLDKNKHLLGLHMVGNSRDTSSLGFLDKILNDDPAAAHIHTRIHESLETGVLTERKRQFKVSSNCWICEGWTQHEFKFIPRKSTEDIIDQFTPVYLHLDCDEYEPDLMIRDPTTGIHSIKRMIPPREVRYFFTFGDHHIRIAKDQNIAPNLFRDEDLDVHHELHMSVPQINTYENSHQIKSLITEEFLDKMAVKPRPDPKYPLMRIRPKTPWDFSKSIFAAYKQDTEELLNSCLNEDWGKSRIPKILDDEEVEDVKEFLNSKYKSIRELYKYYAGIFPSNGVFCISKTLFNEIVNNIQPSIIDNNLSISAIDLEFITTISGFKTGNLNPNRDLIRFQLLELLVRLGIHKYYKSNISATKFDAIKEFFNKDLGSFLEKFQSYKWREEEYFCEEVEYILKEYMPQLDQLFNMYSGKYTLPSQPKFVSLEEFQEMIATSGILSLNIANKDIGKYYNLSLETEIDELETEKHMQMFKLEFYEAIARCADKIVYDTDKIDPNSLDNNKTQKKSRKMTNDCDMVPSINIEDSNSEDLISQSNSSMISDKVDPKNDMTPIIMSDFMKRKSLAFKSKIEDQQNDDASDYSLEQGGEKLYQKLEKFLKVLIQNCFSKKLKRMNTKQSQNLSARTNAYFLDGKDINNKKNSNSFLMDEPKYTFNRALTKNVQDKVLSNGESSINRQYVPQQTSSSANFLKVTI